MNDPSVGSSLTLAAGGAFSLGASNAKYQLPTGAFAKWCARDWCVSRDPLPGLALRFTAMASESYREILPNAKLASRVACFWVQTVGNEPREHRVVPDACADILAFSGGSLVVVGPARQAELVVLPAQTTIVGARFRPGSAPVALGVPANVLLDRTEPLENIWGRAKAERLAGDLHEAPTIERKLAALEAQLLDPSAPRFIDTLVNDAIAWLARYPEKHLHELVASSSLSARQWQRRFCETVGYGPKHLQRVLRFQHLMVLAANQRDHQSLASLAAAAGFLDQAHMTREVRDLAGISPTQLLDRSFVPTSMSEFFNTVGASVR